VKGILAILGSGETAPTMIKPHRALLERAGAGPAVLLDTPYGFQENADDISARARAYFAGSVGRPVDVVSWRRTPEPGLAREQALAALRGAAWVFAGPGSPTYALRQWRDTPLPEVLAERLEAGGTVVFASAAALTLGSHAVPVYEVYKAGEEPRWEPALDLVRRATGLPAVVIPHYDNAEGGHHDTRFCYLGERRLAAMEAELPDGTWILGVDEHTAVVLDLDHRTATVAGRGGLTVRRHGRSAVFGSGAVVGFDELAGAEPAAVQRTEVAVPVPPAPASLGAEADAAEADFEAARAARDVDGCVAAVLALEQSIRDWATDTLTSPEGDHARRVFRGMITRLGTVAAPGPADRRAVARPYVEALLGVRAKARLARDFAASDTVREHLAAAGIEVRDTPDGTEWELR
jgi:cyanophycinase-like exopeptidase